MKSTAALRLPTRLAFALALLAGAFCLADPALAQPAVSAVELVSTPAAGQNGTYKIGDTVRARVTFDTAVDVVGSPELRLRFDPGFGEKPMAFDTSRSRTNTTTLEFTYVVVRNNLSTRGIAFYANKLSVGAGASIRAAGTQQDASLAFARVDHDPAHKVDGFPPTVQRAAVSGRTLKVTFSERMAVASLANGAFTVKKTPSGGSETTVGLSGSPSLAGARLTLTLASAVSATDTVKVSYTKPTTGRRNTLRDAAGNEMANFADRAVAVVGVEDLTPAPAGCGAFPNPGRSDWIASVTSTRTSITVTLGSSHPAGSIEVCRSVPGGSAIWTGAFGITSSAGSSHTITVDHRSESTLLSATDYWVRLRPDSQNPSPWRHIFTKPNNAPRFASNAPSGFSVAENSAAVGTLAATDPDTDDTLTYSLASQASDGADHEAFAIDSAGRITVASGTTLDHETQSSYAITVRVHDGKDIQGNPSTAVDASHDLTVTVTNVAVVSAVALVSEPTVDADGDGTKETYKPGDTVRARVTFDTPVDVVGSPVLKLQFDPEFGEKSMTFDATKGRTNVTMLEFTYTVAAGNLSTQGIAFYANKLSVGEGVSIREAGTQVNANLAFARVDHDPAHKVDGLAPALVAADPVTVTSGAGADATYAIGDPIEITATFTEAVTVATAGDPVAGPRLGFTLGSATKHAVYASGSGTTALVFRYTVAAGDADSDGVAVAANGLALNGGMIADAAGNAAAAAQLEHPAVAAQASHKVDGVRPTVRSAAVDGTTLTVVFSEAPAAAASLANTAFTVKKTPQGGSETTVNLSGSPSISDRTVTLTLASAVVSTDTGVKVSYAVPTSGTDNKLVDAAGNEVAGFTDQAVTNVTMPVVSAVALVSEPTVDADGNGTKETYKPGDTVRARVTFDGPVDVAGSPVLKLQFDPEFGEKSMTFDATKGRTNVTTLEFTYTVVAGNLSTQGIAFYANKLSVGQGVSIRRAGTQVNADLAFARVDHDAAHKVDGVAPALVAADPVSVTSAAGADATYAIGDPIEITATFTEAVTVATAGTPVTGPRLGFTLGAATKHAVYASGSGTTKLVFRYTVAEGDADSDGIAVAANALGLNGGTIADAAGNAAAAAQLEHPAVAAQASHQVDGVRPTVRSAAVDGTTLTVTFSEALGSAASLANTAFRVRKTPQGGSETTVNLSGSPSLSDRTLTLTLAGAVVGTDTGVKVSYAVPTSGTDNKLVDAAGNDVASFADVAVANVLMVSAVALVSEPTVDADGNNTNETYKPGDTVRARVTFNGPVDVVGNPVLKLQLDPGFGEKSMTFDATPAGRT